MSVSDRGGLLQRLGLFALAVILAAMVFVVGCGDDNGPAGALDMAFSDTLKGTFSVDFGPVIDVDIFIGTVIVTPGTTEQVIVTAKKWAASEADLDKVVVVMRKVPGGVIISATNPANVQNVQVDFVITTPEIANWDVSMGLGNIDYTGRPMGQCGFSTGVGSVKLKLPQDINAVVNLSTGVGTVSLGFSIDGQVSSSSAIGTIGNGKEAVIAASASAGTVTVGP